LKVERRREEGKRQKAKGKREDLNIDFPLGNIFR
jgi:hypothetical protein